MIKQFITLILVIIMIGGGIPVFALDEYYSFNLDSEIREIVEIKAEKKGINPDLIELIGYHETRWEWPNDGAYIGFLQISPIHNTYLTEFGIDMYTESGNIEAGCYILSELIEKYGHLGLEAVIVRYECGEYAVESKNITSTRNSRWIIGELEKLC